MSIPTFKTASEVAAWLTDDPEVGEEVAAQSRQAYASIVLASKALTDKVKICRTYHEGREEYMTKAVELFTSNKVQESREVMEEMEQCWSLSDVQSCKKEMDNLILAVDSFCGEASKE